jgi:hypothetical protein
MCVCVCEGGVSLESNALFTQCEQYMIILIWSKLSIEYSNILNNTRISTSDLSFKIYTVWTKLEFYRLRWN